MSLQDWLRNGWLTEQRPSRQEIDDLLRVVERDLADCRAPGLSADWRFNIGYNAALQAATAALAAEGYRAGREAHHFRVLQSLAETTHAEPEFVVRLDYFRKKRNICGYERIGTISDEDAEAMIACASTIRERVLGWLRAAHPELVK